MVERKAPGDSDSNAERAFALHVADLGSTPGTPYGPLSLLEVPDFRARSNSEYPGV